MNWHAAAEEEAHRANRAHVRAVKLEQQRDDLREELHAQLTECARLRAALQAITKLEQPEDLDGATAYHIARAALEGK